MNQNNNFNNHILTKPRLIHVIVVSILLLAFAVSGATASGSGETAPASPERPQAGTQIYLPVMTHNSNTGSDPGGDDSANLKVTLSGPATVLPGETLTYTLTVSNQGPAEAKNARAVDTLPAGVTFKSANASQGSFNSSTGLWTIGNLAKSSSVTLSLAVTVKSDATGTLANQVSVSSDTSDKDPSDNTASVQTTVITKADLRISLTAPASVFAGENLAYTIVVTNDGPTNASGVVATAQTPAGATFDSASATSGSYNSANGQWSISNLALGASAQLTLNMRVNNSTTGNLLGQASVTGLITDDNPGNNSASANTLVNARADLQIIKTGPGLVLVNEDITYTITIKNLGPSNATNVVATDVLPSGVTFKSATPSQGSFTSATGQWTVGTLTANSTVQMTLVATVKSSATGNQTNQVTVTSSANDPNNANNSASVTSLVTVATSVKSDDFNYYPDIKPSLWSSVDPVGDADIFANGSHAVIRVPGGVTHSPWRGGVNRAPRIMQRVINEDFEVEVKFDSKPQGTYTGQGFIAQQDSNNFIRFEYYSYGSTIYVYASAISGGAEAKKIDISIGVVSSAPMFLRVDRQGNQWKMDYSLNGTDWTEAANFSQAMIVKEVGVYAGNSSDSSDEDGTPPPFLALVDYFFNSAEPIVPEDPIHPSFIFSDDFSTGSLSSFWTYIDPAMDSPLSFTGTNLEIAVPGGSNHDPWTGTENRAPRLMQAASDRSFEIEVKFDSMLSGTYTSQGLLVENDANDALQFYFYSDQSGLNVYATKIIAGVSTPEYNAKLTGLTSPMYLRINRSGDWWVLSYSADGTIWNTVDSFSYDMPVTAVGIIVGNEHSSPAPPLVPPAITGSIDYFFNTATPITPQD